jgi:hypothetical protein
MAKRKSQKAPQEPPQLPLRWVVILALTGLAAVSAHTAGGPALAITAAAAVLVALQAVIK